MTEPIAAIVLAGGRSTRFGRDKLAEPIDGRAMLDRAIDAVRLVANDVVVVTAPGAVRTITPGIVLVRDVRPFEGPLAGLATGLAALPLSAERVIVVAGDMPSLVPAVLDRLLSALDAHEAAVLADDVGPRPLPMAIRRTAAAPAVERLLAGGERRLRALIDLLDSEIVEPATWRNDDPTGATLTDVDTPADLPSNL